MPKRPKALRAECVFTVAYWSLVAMFAAWVIWLFSIRVLQINFDAQWVAGLFMLAMAFVTAYTYFRRRIVRKFLAPHQGFVCPACHYSLRKLPDSGECPECGTTYTRSGVVRLWQQHYGVGASFPQTGSSEATVRLETRAVVPEVPWASRSMSAAANGVEAMARRRGYRAPRLAASPNELSLAAGRRGKAFPSEVEALYFWFDPAMWAAAMGVLEAGKIEESWEAVASSRAPRQQPALTFRRPDELRVYRVVERPADLPVLERFLGRRRERGDVDAWANSTFVELADAAGGACVIYCPDPPDASGPYLFTMLPGHADRVWLADSIAGWLLRLSAFDGIEPAFEPSSLNAIPEGHRAAYLREFGARNPSLSLFETVRI